jgi:hypothetical protein
MLLSKDAKKCPFCGGNMFLATRFPYGTPEPGTLCEPCCCKCGARLGSSYPTTDEAVKEWNKRAAVDEVDFVVAVSDGHRWVQADSIKEHECMDLSKDPDWFICSECNCKSRTVWEGRGLWPPSFCPACGAKVRRFTDRWQHENPTNPAWMTE